MNFHAIRMQSGPRCLVSGMSPASIADSDVCSKYLRHVAALFENNNRDKHAGACVCVRECPCRDKS